MGREGLEATWLSVDLDFDGRSSEVEALETLAGRVEIDGGGLEGLAREDRVAEAFDLEDLAVVGGRVPRAADLQKPDDFQAPRPESVAAGGVVLGRDDAPLGGGLLETAEHFGRLGRVDAHPDLVA